MDFFENWLKFDKWSFLEAALLFNGRDPDQPKPLESFHTWGHSKPELPNQEYGKDVSLTYQIFSRASWRKYDADAPKFESTRIENYFQFANDNDLDVNETLKAKWVLQQKYGDQKYAISETMIETLSPLVSIIEDFKNSTEFKKRESKIPQQLITEWLQTRNLTRDCERTVRDLITRHYKITSGRK